MIVAATAGASSGKAFWYLTRGTGVVSLLLLTASVVLGIVTSVRWVSERWPRFLTAGLHRNVSLLVLVFLGIHITTAIADGFAPIGWRDAVLPFLSGYRPLWLGFGTLAVDLLLAVTITSLLRERIGYHAWRVVHWAAYACWPVALLHGLGTGTDTQQTFILAVSLVCLVAVVLAVWWRVAAGWPAHTTARLVSGIASVMAPLAIVTWLLSEPLQPGWARKSGTPTALLASTRATAVTTSTGAGDRASSVGTDVFASAFRARIQGTISQSRADASGVTTVRIRTALSEGASGTLDITITGTALADGGVQMNNGSVTVGPSGDPARYQGSITSLDGTQVSAVVRDGSGGTERVDVRLDIAANGTTVSGVVQGTPQGNGAESGADL